MSHHTDLVAINTVFLSVKIFDYLNKSPAIQLLSSTLYRAREDTLYFILIFIVLILGFVGLSYLSFGAHLQGFSTLLSSLRMNFQTTLGEFDFGSMYDVDPVMAVLYFFPFNILFVFILTNIFLAIINQTYKETKLIVSKLSKYEALKHLGSSHKIDDVSIIRSLLYFIK